jgi:hypothetical protein
VPDNVLYLAKQKGTGKRDKKTPVDRYYEINRTAIEIASVPDTMKF